MTNELIVFTVLHVHFSLLYKEMNTIHDLIMTWRDKYEWKSELGLDKIVKEIKTQI